MGCCSTLRLLLGLAALHQGLLLQVFILAKWWRRVIQPHYQVSCWRRTTSQKLSTTWRLCLWGIAKIISIFWEQCFFKAIWWQVMNWDLQKQLPVWPVDGEEPWWLHPRGPQAARLGSISATKVWWPQHSVVSSTPHSAGAWSKVFSCDPTSRRGN